MADSPTGGWVELSLIVSDEAVDAVSEVFRGNGVAGIAIEPSARANSDEGTSPGQGPSRVLAYLPSNQGIEGRARKIEEDLWHLKAFDLAPMSRMSRRLIDEQDWANAWKEHFYPVRIGKRIVVKPTWREFEKRDDDVVLELDPGMAFGTGLHPTTRMMLEALEECVRPGMTILDLGTGSGILAIATVKLAAAKVLALDVDEQAVTVASQNVRTNAVEAMVEVRQGSVDTAAYGFDIIAANIVATVIADLAPEFRRVMHANSILIVSGIIRDRLQLVEEAFAHHGLARLQSSESGDWLCLIARLGVTP